MSSKDDESQILPLTRRNLLLSSLVGLGLVGTATAQTDGSQGRLTGGQYALSQAYNSAGDLYIGPDSAKTNVTADTPRIYFASDTESVYYGDGGSWVEMTGLGGGGTDVTLQDDGSTVVDPVGTLDFAGSDFDVTNPSGDTGQVILTNSSITINSGDGLSGGETVPLGGSATLNAALDIDDSGSNVTEGHGIDFDSNLSVTDDGDGTVTVSATSGGALTDSGSDNSDGGNIYQLPQTEDSIDGQGGGELTSFEQVSLADAAAQPAANGEVQRSGTDVYVYSGGSARNLSNVGSGGSAITAQEDGSDLTTDLSLLNAADGVTATNPTGDEIELFTQNVTTQTASYTASEQDVVLGDASGGAFSVTLPSPTTDVDVVVKKIDSSNNAVSIVTPSTETIDGDSMRSISGQYVSRRVVSDGSDYFIV